MDKPLGRVVKTVKKKLDESVRVPQQHGNVYLVLFTWRGKMMQMKCFFPEIKKPTRKEVSIALDKVYPSSTLRSYYLSSIDYGEPYINVGKGDGIT